MITYLPTDSEVKSNFKRTPEKSIDRASLAFGGKVVRVSNEHYGPGAQVVSPFIPLHMFDGFESARSRKAGHHEEIHLSLSEPTQIRAVRFNFKFFVNNNPKAVSILGRKGNDWVEIAPSTNVKAFAGNQKEIAIASKDKFSEVLVKVFPDGGIHRIQVFGD